MDEDAVAVTAAQAAASSSSVSHAMESIITFNSICCRRSPIRISFSASRMSAAFGRGRSTRAYLSVSSSYMMTISATSHSSSSMTMASNSYMPLVGSSASIAVSCAWSITSRAYRRASSMGLMFVLPLAMTFPFVYTAARRDSALTIGFLTIKKMVKKEPVRSRICWYELHWEKRSELAF